MTPLPPRRPQPPLSAAVRVAGASGALLLALAAVDAHAPDQPAEDAGAPEEPVAVDTRPKVDASVRAGPPVPLKPEPWQKTGRCQADAEERIRGACYVRTAKTPPCPASFFEHEGACFVAVAATKRPDTSVEE